MLAPLRQGGGDLAFVTVLVVDRYKAALAVIDAQLGNMRRDAKLAQAGAKGSAQIVMRPIRYTGTLIERLFGMRPIAESAVAIAEQIVSPVALLDAVNDAPEHARQ